MTASTPARYFDELYASEDPYGYRDRWYEQRKRSLLLASLPLARYRSAWELGCSNGELTVELGQRCDRVLATDLSERAVTLTRERSAHLDNVTAQQATHPVEWPDETFDLIVFSEIGYFLSQPDLDMSCARMRNALHAAGTLIACHWLAPFEEAPLSGRDVHETLASCLHLASVFRYEDADFMLEAWSSDPRSVAMREGIR